jgi:hypothetical protein
MITRINYQRQIVYVLHVLTHAEYDKGDWKWTRSLLMTVPINLVSRKFWVGFGRGMRGG